MLRSIYDMRIETPATLPAGLYFPAGARFAERWKDIRREALAIGDQLERAPRFHEIMREQASISAQDGRDWRMFLLKAYGIKVEQNLQKCPTVASLLADTPEVVSCVFSILAPGKHIPRHRGPFRGILRFHLMLVVPLANDGLPAATLEIDGVEYRLAEGDHLLWDDTYPHEVWNRGDAPRIALLFDVRRPGMPYDMKILSWLVVSAVQLSMRWNGTAYGG